MELKARIQEATQAVKDLLSSLASLYFAEKRRVTLPHTP